MASGLVTVKSVDMRDDMQQEAISCAMRALEVHDVEKDIASFIKKYFDGKYEPTWHCIVGQSFGSFVTHESGHFIYLYIGGSPRGSKRYFSSRLVNFKAAHERDVESISALTSYQAFHGRKLVPRSRAYQEHLRV